MLILHDISNFMSWWVSQVVRIFSYLFNTLASFEFANTNLLQVLLSLIILGALLPVLLTLTQNNAIRYTETKTREKRFKNDKK